MFTGRVARQPNRLYVLRMLVKLHRSIIMNCSAMILQKAILLLLLLLLLLLTRRNKT